MMEKKQNLDQTKLAEFFPLEVAIRGMLEIFETLFGLVFVELSVEARKELMSKQGESIESMAWDQDVVVYSAWNDDVRGGEFLGYLYLDILKRDGKKDHASNIKIQRVSSPSLTKEPSSQDKGIHHLLPAPLPQHPPPNLHPATHTDLPNPRPPPQPRNHLPRARPRHPRPRSGAGT